MEILNIFQLFRQRKFGNVVFIKLYQDCIDRLECLDSNFV